MDAPTINLNIAPPHSLGSNAAWAQRRFWGAAIAKGSWFAHLQSAGMKLGTLPGLKKILVGVGVSAGIVKSILRC
jgi:hypothetical protein